jgi:pyruvate dehydrogenase E2 component (dihydrolipoamide acetyltransferase)
MSDLKYFKLPDVGEGLTEAEIVGWKVKAGDTVRVNDVIVEIETAKSLVELPCPFSGTVSELLVAEGDTVTVGSPIIAVQTGDATTSALPAADAPVADEAQPPAEAAEQAQEPAEPPAVAGSAEDMIPTPKADEPVEPGLIGGPAPGGRTSVLVGYGPRTTEAKRRPRKGVPAPGPSAAAAQAGVQHSFTPHSTVAPSVAIEDAAPAAPGSGSTPASAGEGSARVAVMAKPPIRKLAKDLGVDLAEVTPTGDGGTITRADVEQHAAGGAPATAATAAQPAWAESGELETRVPVKGVRKVTAQAMVASAFTAPHVTEWLTIDATRTMKMVERLRERSEFRDVKVSPLLIVARAVCLATRRTPEVNAAWDDAAQEIVLKRYVNLGIAAATPRGLLVPNIKNAHALSAVDLAAAINDLAATARAGRTQPADQAGGTITITNVGVFGVDAGTPIINPGETAILAMGAVKRQPWVVGNRIKPRWVTTLALSFDHRVVDGQQGSRFLADVAAIVEDPGTALLF